MNPVRAAGYGDEATWPPCYGHPNDPRTEDDFDDEPDDDNSGTCQMCGRAVELRPMYAVQKPYCDECEAELDGY